MNTTPGTVRCLVCNVEVGKYRLNRHKASKTHRRMLVGYYEWLPSDDRFTRFLYSIKPSQLRGYERRLFQHYREELQA